MGFVPPDKFAEMILNEQNALSEKAVEKIVGGGFKLGRDVHERGAANGNPVGRKKGDGNIPPIFREIIAVQANVSGDTAKEIAAAYGVSKDRVDKFRQGDVNPNIGGNASDRALKLALDKSLGRVRDKALDRIMKAMDCMTDDKFTDRTARELSMIVNNLSGVVRNTMPKGDDFGAVNFQTIFMTPETKDISTLPTIDV